MEPAAGRIDPMRLFQRGKRRNGGAARSQGFTLLELLLALVLTSLILAGVYNMFGSQEKAQIVVDQVAEMNQNLRAGMIMLTRDMRMAGFRMEQPLGGIDALIPYDGGDPADGQNSDSVEFHYADEDIMTLLTGAVGAANPSSLTVADTAVFDVPCLAVITDGNNSSMVYVTAVQDAVTLTLDTSSNYYDPGAGGAFPGYGVGSRVYQAVYRSYCIDHTDPDHPVLRRRQHVTPTSGAETNPADLVCSGGEPIADYIEDFQIVNGDGSAPTANNRSYIIRMTARTRKPMPGMAGFGGRKRKSISQEVRIRNQP